MSCAREMYVLDLYKQPDYSALHSHCINWMSFITTLDTYTSSAKCIKKYVKLTHIGMTARSKFVARCSNFNRRSWTINRPSIPCCTLFQQQFPLWPVVTCDLHGGQKEWTHVNYCCQEDNYIQTFQIIWPSMAQMNSKIRTPHYYII